MKVAKTEQNKDGGVDCCLADGHRAFTITSSGALRVNPETYFRPEFVAVRKQVLSRIAPPSEE